MAQVEGLPSDQRPCTTGGKAYLRQSDGDYEMSDAEVAQMHARRERPRFDATPVASTSVDDLDPDVLSGFLTEVRSNSRRLATASDEDVLRNKGVLAHGTGELTLAGLYALGSYPQRFIPSLSLTAAAEGTGTERSRDLVHLDGPLPEMLDQAIGWVRRNTRSVVRFGQDGHGRDEAEIPLVAVRELIANALVHRDLSSQTQGKRVEIRMKEDFLVVGNPGGLWGLSVDQLGKQGGKSAVNEYLYEICKYVRTSSNTRVIEGEGGGIQAVHEALREASMQPAKFMDAGVRFTALLPRHALLPPEDLAWLASLPEASHLTDLQRAIAVSMRHGTTWTNPLVRDEFAPIDSTDARAALQGLVTSGIAKTEGARRGTRYMISDRFRVPTAKISTSILRELTDISVLIPPASGSDSSWGGEAAKVKNAPQILAALEANGPLGTVSLINVTGLSRRQVTYALRRLIALEAVHRKGALGNPRTVYSLASPPHLDSPTRT